jgi:hypothetical protein
MKTGKIILFWSMSRKGMVPDSYQSMNYQSWASASRSMPPTSVFRHPVSQSGTGAFQYWIGFLYSGTGLVPASTFLLILVSD